MFNIEFTNDATKDGNSFLQFGIITIGKWSERFSASLSFWSKQDYQAHWLDASKEILKPNSKAAFITSMYDPKIANFINWWPVWRTDDLVVFQERILLLQEIEGLDNDTYIASDFSLEFPYKAVPNWDSTHSDKCQQTGICQHQRLGKQFLDENIEFCPSEWCVSILGIEEFIKRNS